MKEWSLEISANDLLKHKPYSFQDSLTKEWIDQKEKVLIEVMKMVLKREPTEDDAKDFGFIIQTDKPGREFFAYKGKLLGEIEFFQKRNKAFNWIIGFEFVPKETID